MQSKKPMSTKAKPGKKNETFPVDLLNKKVKIMTADRIKVSELLPMINLTY